MCGDLSPGIRETRGRHLTRAILAGKPDLQVELTDVE
jgi:hypothetical protein